MMGRNTQVHGFVLFLDARSVDPTDAFDVLLLDAVTGYTRIGQAQHTMPARTEVPVAGGLLGARIRSSYAGDEDNSFFALLAPLFSEELLAGWTYASNEWWDRRALMGRICRLTIRPRLPCRSRRTLRSWDWGS